MDPTGWAFLGYSDPPVAGDRPIPPGSRRRGVHLRRPGGDRHPPRRRPAPNAALPRAGANDLRPVHRPGRPRPRARRTRRLSPCHDRLLLAEARVADSSEDAAPPSSPCARRPTWIPDHGSPRVRLGPAFEMLGDRGPAKRRSAPPGPRSVAARRRLSRARGTRSPDRSDCWTSACAGLGHDDPGSLPDPDQRVAVAVDQVREVRLPDGIAPLPVPKKASPGDPARATTSAPSSPCSARPPAT